MKKIFQTLVTAVVLSLSISAVSFAGSWQTDAVGKWWKNDDGSFPSGGWQWIDDNGDGIANSYYFDANGYLLVNTTTPDGYTVDGNGAWIVNNVVQTQTVAAPPATQANKTSNGGKTVSAASGISSTPYDGYTIVVNTSTKKYHVPSCKSVKSMKDKNKGYSSDAAYLESHGYQACKNCH